MSSLCFPMLDTFGRLKLEFDGRCVSGRGPLAVLQSPDGPDTLAGLKQALKAIAQKHPQGVAIGYFAYEAGAMWEQAWQPAHHPDIPLYRLVCFKELEFGPLGARASPIPLRPLELAAHKRHLYLARLQSIKDYISAGDIYQANLTESFFLPQNHSPSELHERLRSLGEAPYSALLEWPDFSIISNSPESFLIQSGNEVTARPIKGTIRRGEGEAEDQQLRNQLLASAKDKAENVMIVDLLRNDLGKVCVPGSINVPELAALRTYPTLHHLVSTVRGTLNSGLTNLDAFAAAFPCGSITGAPKLRAQQILGSLEPGPRGVHMGAIGYFAFNGDMEWNVAIRTATVRKNLVTFHAGGGIVADSDPETELEEMLLKAMALASAAALTENGGHH